MKKRKQVFWVAAALAAAISVCRGFEVRAEGSETITYDQVAAADERAETQAVGLEGMVPVYGEDIKDGTYEVEVECSSAMFRVQQAVLTVENGTMEATLTLHGTSYLDLYPGTAEEAARADQADYVENTSDDPEQSRFVVPVEALDQPVACAAFSRRKEKWYDRQLLFCAESLPEEAVLTELPDYAVLRKEAKERRIEAMKAENAAHPAEAEALMPELSDGTYTMEVVLGGGSGRSGILSPTELTLRDGVPYAKIIWNSNSYDYMLAGGEKYLPLQEPDGQEGHSVFELPVTVFDEPVDVVGDTTAMSTPHEIEYTLTFRKDSIREGSLTASEPSAASGVPVELVLEALAVGIGLAVIFMRRGLRRK